MKRQLIDTDDSGTVSVADNMNEFMEEESCQSSEDEEAAPATSCGKCSALGKAGENRESNFFFVARKIHGNIS